MPTDVLQLRAALQDYANWYKTVTPPDPAITLGLGRAGVEPWALRPSSVPQTEPQPSGSAKPLFVHRLWEGDGLPASPDPPAGWKPSNFPIRQLKPDLLCVDTPAITTAENKIWLITCKSPRAVYCVDPSTLQLVATYPVPPRFDPEQPREITRHRFLAVNPQWIVVSLNDRILLCSRSDQQRHALDLPPSTYKPYWIDQSLYLLYDVERGGSMTMGSAPDDLSLGTGLVRVTFPEEKIEYVISSRRIPPQNGLDGSPFGKPLAVWKDKAGLKLASTGDYAHASVQIYAESEGDQGWGSIFFEQGWDFFRPMTAGALVIQRNLPLGFKRISWMDEKGPEVLLASSESVAASPGPAPVWKFPEELTLQSKDFGREFSVIKRGDDLCLYVDPHLEDTETKPPCLYYFARGQSEGIKIPVAYDLDQLRRALAKFQPEFFPQRLTVFDPTTGMPIDGALSDVLYWGREVMDPMVYYLNLYSTDDSLIISGSGQAGFWVIPWSDIDAYRARRAVAAKDPTADDATK